LAQTPGGILHPTANSGRPCRSFTPARFLMIADGKKAISDRIKAIHGHFYPIADHLKAIPDRFDPTADHLKAIADGKKAIRVRI
jgi:hypothetical protein